MVLLRSSGDVIGSRCWITLKSPIKEALRIQVSISVSVSVSVSIPNPESEAGSALISDWLVPEGEGRPSVRCRSGRSLKETRFGK